MSDVTIFHTPQCSTSRQTLEIIREAGVEPTIVLHKEVGWTADQLQRLAGRAGVPVSAFLRAKEPLAQELGLTGPEVSEDTVTRAMVEHPNLVERPLVESPRGVVMARPKERVREIL